MAKMLDLSVFEEETFDIKFTKDDILHVRKPSENLALKILAHVNVKTENVDAAQMLTITRDMTKSILNYNKDQRTFSDEWIKEHLPLKFQLAIIQGYTSFMTELENNPN